MLKRNASYPTWIEKSDLSDVLFVTEASLWGKLGYDIVAAAFPSLRAVYWSPGMPEPDLTDWHGDWIISFKADLILSRATLERAKKGAINFHPSLPKYRGLGGYWWALHNEDEFFGVTIHHMDEKIDHGAIIKVDSFPISADETVESLKRKAAAHALKHLADTVNDIINEKRLVPCEAKWEDHLYTNKELAKAQLLQRSTAATALQTLSTVHDQIVEPKKSDCSFNNWPAALSA